MFRTIIAAASLLLIASPSAADAWKDDSVWHDGLVEKATYTATRTLYGKPREYTAIFFTNKEQHDRKTWTKAETSSDTIEVFKHNQVEVVPTPNYDYKFVTTSHLRVDNLILTRLDASSQEFCGTSFKQYLFSPSSGGNYHYRYFSFSYMPEAGRRDENVAAARAQHNVAADSLPLWLRDYDFASRQPQKFNLYPSQKSNRDTPYKWVEAEVRHAGEDGDADKLEVRAAGKLLGTYWMAKDRLHVMTRYEGADGQTYELQKVERVDYWTIKGE